MEQDEVAAEDLGESLENRLQTVVLDAVARRGRERLRVADLSTHPN